MKKSTKDQISGIFFIIGVLLLIMGGTKINSNHKFVKKADITEVKITKIISNGPEDFQKEIYVDYVVKGKAYKNIRIHNFPFSNIEKEKIEVYYLKKDPTVIKYKTNMYTSPIIIIITGSIFLITAIVMLAKILKEEELLILKEKGIKFCAVVNEIEVNEDNKDKKGNILYIIFCTYTDDHNQTHKASIKKYYKKYDCPIFKGMSINIYTDKDDYNNYYIDL